MASFKLCIFAAVVAIASAQYHGGYHHAAPAYQAAPAFHHVQPVVKAIVAEHEAPAHYQFAYSVHDEHTHDIKEQHETREGDKVQGYYSLVEPDGTRRIVHYTADKHNGFNAVVERQGHAAHPQQVAHKVIAAPVVHKVAAAPVFAHAAPVYGHAAPVYSHGAPAAAHSAASSISQVNFSGHGHGYHH